MSGQPPANPFSTRATLPGAIPFVFHDGQTVEGLVERLGERGWRGAIVGPHGSGKSTLLVELLAAVERRFGRTTLFILHEGQRRLPRGWRQRARDARLIAVDGYEQLGRIAAWQLRRLCRSRGPGLLVTAHGAVSIPTVYETRPTLALARSIVEHLLPDEAKRPDDAHLAALFRRHEGNLREVLFSLYDAHEES